MLTACIDKMIDIAQRLGALTPAAIFALIAMHQGYINYRKDRDAFVSNEKWRGTREGQVRAEEGQTLIMGKQVDVLAMNTASINSLSAQITHLATLIDERIPKGGNHA